MEATLTQLVAMALKGAAILGLAALIAAVLRNASAARRHLVWSAAVTAVLLIPLLAFVVPAWGVLPTVEQRAGPQPSRDVAAPPSAASWENAPAAVARDVESTAAQIWTPAAVRGETRMDPAQLVVLVWLMIAALALLRVVAGCARIRGLARRARPLPAGRVRDAAEAVSHEFGVQVRLVQGREGTMPMTWGVFRPTVMLPAGAGAWSDVRLRAVLGHELAHVRRRDPLWQLVAELTCALHWFNPLAWYAAHRMRIEREHACDDAVLQRGSRASEYAAELLEIARSLRAARATSLAAIAMARPRQLEGRLLAVLDGGRARGEVRRRWPVWATAAVIVVPIAAAQPALSDGLNALPTEHLAAAEPAAPRPLARKRSEPTSPHETPVMTASLVPQTPDCLRGELRQMSTSVSQNDERTRVKWETRGCKGTVEILGTARVAGDLTGFQSISPGGRVTIETQDADGKRKLRLTPAGNRFTYQYEVDGRARPWGQAGEAWLASVMTMLVRRAGFGAEERVDYLLGEKGIAGVLEEVELVGGDYAQRKYLTLLLNKTTLNGGAVRSVIELAGREMESDYELAETLIAVTRKYGLTPESRTAYLGALRSIDSDYERGRALKMVFDRGTPSTAELVTVLELAAGMESSYERGQVLKLVRGSADFRESRLQEAYLKAAAEMESDYELRQALSAFVGKERLSPAAIDVVLAAAASLDSDYERTELLVQLINTQSFTPAQRNRLVKLTDEMDSEYERGRVSSLLIKQLNN